MIFWIFLFFAILPLIAITIGVIIVNRTEDAEVEGCTATLSLSTVPFSVIAIVIIISVWSSYSSDYAKVVAQQEKINVYEERIESLESRLSSFNFPEKPSVSLDADTPWATMTESLTEAETKLAQIKDERATAIRNIKQWSVGPMSGIVTFVGKPEYD